MKHVGNLFIIGDSYSTYEGYIPEGFCPFYTIEGREGNDVISVDQTWWKILIDNSDAELIQNCSWSGTTICNTGYEGADASHKSFISRFDKLCEQGFFKENKIDTVLVYGGTNDAGANSPLGEYKYDNFTKDDLYCVRPAIAYLAKRIKEELPNAQIVFIINEFIGAEVVDALKTVVEKKGVEKILINDKHLTFGAGHPTVKGMKWIGEQVIKYFE